MITKIEIKNFKSLADTVVECRALNVITGINGMGKSSLIQALLLLRQAYIPNGIGRGIPLKGNLTGNLGTFNDVLYRNALDDRIEISIENDDIKYRWEFVKGAIDDLLQGEFPNVSVDLPLFSNSGFQYIGAGRITPNSTFLKSGEALAYKQFGTDGEFVIQYLFEKGTDEVAIISEEIDNRTKKPLPLLNQVDHWLKQITPNVTLDILPKSSLEYELRYKFLSLDKGFASYSANNAPFGLTFALPIITALLASKKGDLIILENPESDLHPRAQSIIGQLIARVAKEGVQIFVETHSDHILNGICVAIHNKLLSNDATKLIYFHREFDDLHASTFNVTIKSNGRIDDSSLRELGIEGFFDQSSKDLENILFS